MKWLIPKSSSANDGCDKDKEILRWMKKKRQNSDEKAN